MRRKGKGARADQGAVRPGRRRPTAGDPGLPAAERDPEWRVEAEAGRVAGVAPDGLVGLEPRPDRVEMGRRRREANMIAVDLDPAKRVERRGAGRSEEPAEDLRTLRLPALGGSLFDPDRYPFLDATGELHH